MPSAQNLRQRHPNCRRVLRAGSFVLLLGLSGCGDKPKDADTQLAAEVNGGGISVHQVQAVLSKAPQLMAADPAQAPRRALESLIEQELATQAAREAGLDSSPTVLQAIEVAKREVLARYYQDQLAAKAPPPADADIEEYYVDHPLLFSERRMYTVQEMEVQGAAGKVEQAIADASSAGDVELAVRKVGLSTRSRVVVQSAEDIPMALLERFAGLTPGRSMMVTQGPAVRVYTLISAFPAPVDRAQAREAIVAFLAAEARRTAVRQGMKALRDSAQIRYLGTFAKSDGAGPPAALTGSASTPRAGSSPRP